MSFIDNNEENDEELEQQLLRNQFSTLIEKGSFEISYLGTTNIIFSMLVMVFALFAVAVYFLVINIIRFVQYRFFLNGIWIGFASLLTVTSFLTLSVFVFLTFSFCTGCMETSHKIVKGFLKYLMVGILLSLVINFFFSFFYVATDTILVIYGYSKYANGADIFGDIVVMILTMTAVIIFNWLQREVFLRIMQKKSKSLNTPESQRIYV